MSKKPRFDIRQNISYILIGLSILGLVFVGSSDKSTHHSSSLNIASLATSDFSISSDQLSEFYVIASLADSMNLNSREALSYNYIAVSTSMQSGQSSPEHIDKPIITDTSDISRDGIKTYIVKAGDSLASIASAYGVSTDQIRWSNGKKTESIDAGETLYIPGVPGIIYTVKSDDTLASIISKTGASESQTIILNDKETDASVREGEKLILVNGTLPETERPEYVAPIVYTYTYLGNTAERIDIQVIGWNWAYGGQCVGYAIWYRNESGVSPLRPIPTTWGNANTWAYYAAIDGYRVDHSPEVGAIFQTPAGWYGHVGIVTGINPDGSIVVEETNYSFVPGRVTRATIPANIVGNFNYIH